MIELPQIAPPPRRYPIWSSGDLDGFFGLMVDNLVQVLLIVSLCTHVVGMSREFVFHTILPGVAISLLVGNLFYAAQAHWVARRHNNPDCTALPFGINTPTVFAFILFVMKPTYDEALHGGSAPEAASALAWRAGLLACAVSGLIEFFGAFVAERLRRFTPRAALLGVLAAIGITFIAGDFAFRIYTQPLVGLPPLIILMLAYFAYWKFPFRLPGGFIAVLIGTAAAWLLSIPFSNAAEPGTMLMSAHDVATGWAQRGWIVPRFVGNELLSVLSQPDLLLRFLTISIPMGLMNVLGSLQNIESAEAGGDRFATGPSLAVNGLGTLAACCFGSCFPTTIYIGHPGWKALGARAGYSILNGLFFSAVFLSGLGAVITALVPIEAGAAIVLYIGIIIAAQAFQATPAKHAPAVAIALFPAIGAFALMLIANYFDVLARFGWTTKTLGDLLGATDERIATLAGILALTGANCGWLIVSLILAALGAALIDRRFKIAAAWCAVAAGLTLLGMLHAYRLDGNTLRELFIWQPSPSAPVGWSRALPIAAVYAASSALFWTIGALTPRADQPDPIAANPQNPLP